jgi:hypothetical protein
MGAGSQTAEFGIGLSSGWEHGWERGGNGSRPRVAPCVSSCHL